MDLSTITAITAEYQTALPGRRFGKVFLLSRFDLAFDLRIPDSRFLFVSIEPADPRTYLIRRRLRDIEKRSTAPTAFLLHLKKQLSGTEVTSVEQVPDERVITLNMNGRDEMGEKFSRSLVFQLTGKSANIFLLDDTRRIIDSMREPKGRGQAVTEIYAPPQRPEGELPAPRQIEIEKGDFALLSDALDAADLERRSQNELRSAAAAARSKIKTEILKLERLKAALRSDRTEHGDAEKWKRFGDLLLANIATAKSTPDGVEVTDYFDQDLATVEVAVKENESITEAAERYFRRYTKSRNAGSEIAKRMASVEADLARLADKLTVIERAVAEQDVERLRELGGAPQKTRNETKRSKATRAASFARIFYSSEGFEILVGKRSADNGHLTFRIARSLDTWMHAADYPGSHVVIRNPNRVEIPHATLVEAARLAAFYSQGKAQPKAAVHYTQKKFVNKPKGSAPGLVSLSSFKTLLVEPTVPETVTRPQP